jgi:HlyD family secretion protein
MIKNLLKFLKKHKIIAGVIILIIIVVGYFLYNSANNNKIETRYVLAVVEKGTIISSVSGTGQISASNQVDLKTKAAGDLLYLNAKVGQKVKAGELLAQLDTSDTQKTIRDAEASLESAKLSLEKLKQPASILAILQSENSLISAQETKQTAQENLDKSYTDGFNTVTNSFLDLPTIMTDIDDIFFTNSIQTNYLNIDWYANQVNRWDYNIDLYKNDLLDNYDKAKDKYDKNLIDYKNTTRYSDLTTVESIINQTYETTKLISDTIKSAKNYVDFVKSILVDKGLTVPTIISTHQTSLDTMTQTANAHLTSLLNAKQAIVNYKESIASAERSITEKTQSLADLKAGADAIDIRSQELSIKQKENSLLDAKEKLADYYIRAPFAGTVATVSAKKGDSLSSGTSVITLITDQHIAEISLNEVDVAKVKAEQKVNLTFDAIENLTISGQVAEVDTLGTVSQGVVTYNIKITFDTEDARIKSGMSVSADIITDVKQDIVSVANSAIKSSGDTYYVETFDNLTTLPSSATTTGITSSIPPNKINVETGLANDSLTEIIQGLKEGDIIVVRTISSKTQATTTTSGSTTRNLFQMGGGTPR